MNRIVWAEMQSMDVLQQVDVMLPNLVNIDEEERRWHGDRYRRARQSKDSLSTEKRGKGKVVLGVSLVAAGVTALVFPGNAFMAARIQQAFALTGMAIGGLFGPQGAAAGWGIGMIAGGVVAAVWVYGVPMSQIVVGGYLVVSGLIEMATG